MANKRFTTKGKKKKCEDRLRACVIVTLSETKKSRTRKKQVE
jgi:hypothetical protein